MAGIAVTVAPVVEFNPVPGVQVYVLAPLAVSVAVPPIKTVAEFTVTTTVPLPTVTVEAAEEEHPLLVPVTVKTVVIVGFAVTMLPVVKLSPVAGVHE